MLIDVQQNGDMVVTETQTYVFTGPHDTERFRRIPLEKVDGITSVRVSQDGRDLPSDTDVDDGQLWIRWSHLPLNPPEKATFVLEYRVLGGLHLDEDGDQVYWKALFKERGRSHQQRQRRRSVAGIPGRPGQRLPKLRR